MLSRAWVGLAGGIAFGFAVPTAPASAAPGATPSGPVITPAHPPQPSASPRYAGRTFAMDAPIPQAPAQLGLSPQGEVSARELGTPTTLFVNFDGVHLEPCAVSNSKKDCHWYNTDDPFPAFSGTIQTQVSILQAMRRDASDYGIRITATRPPDDEDYTMIVYGGTEMDYGALGSAPAGDCGNQLPNQIVFAHLDGELNDWVNGGATAALHEAAHSWGLDHIDTSPSIMFPAGNNAATTFLHQCADVVENTALEPGEAACPEINALFCDDGNGQDAPSVLTHLFGPAYVDSSAPQLTLVEPEPGAYFQAPAAFDVVFELDDDLHPQVYRMAAWIGDETPPDPSVLLEPGFAVNELPVGTWEFHVQIADEAGNSSILDFEIEVGLDPPPVDDPDDGGCACRAPRAPDRGPRGWPTVALMLFGMPWLARRARKPEKR